MKVYWGSEGIAPHITDLSIRWTLVQFIIKLQFKEERGKSGMQTYY
jgi:hypothetical protein